MPGVLRNRMVAPVQCLAVTLAQGVAAPAKKAWRDKGPNSILQEIHALIEAKKNLFLEEMDCTNPRDLMNPKNSKWKWVFNHVMGIGYSPCMRDGLTCKTKWN